MKAYPDKCNICGGAIKSSQTTLELWRGEELLVIAVYRLRITDYD